VHRPRAVDSTLVTDVRAAAPDLLLLIKPAVWPSSGGRHAKSPGPIGASGRMGQAANAHESRFFLRSSESSIRFPACKWSPSLESATHAP
jgi:hypothetical protein